MSSLHLLPIFLSALAAQQPDDFIVAGPNTKSAMVIATDWQKGRWCDWGGHAILQRYARLITEKRARIAYAFWRFYNQIAERVAKAHPEKRLGCFAYAGLRAVPDGSIKIHPMIVPYVTVDSALSDFAGTA